MTGALTLPANGLVAGTNQLVISGGKVGIGTTNPDQDFSILKASSGVTVESRITNGSDTASSNSQSSAIVAGTSSGNALFSAGVSGTRYWHWGIDNGDSDSWKLNTNTDYARDLANPAMTVTTAGRLGVGTTSPLTPLHVLGGITSEFGASLGGSLALNGRNPAAAGVKRRKWNLISTNEYGSTTGLTFYEYSDVDDDGSYCDGDGGACDPRVHFAAGGSVGIGTTGPNPGAVLDVTSTTKGFLPPRMTTAQRDAIPTPPVGLVVYNTSTNALNVYNGAWTGVSSGDPVGSVQCFAQPTIPAGYIEADGTNVSRTTYAGLFAALGTAYGEGDGSTTFGLPLYADPPALEAPGQAKRYYRIRLTSADAQDSIHLGNIELQWDDTWQTNAMTGASSGTIGGLSVTASASTMYSATYAAWKAFDSSGSTGWWTPYGTYGGGNYDELSPVWVKIDFGANPVVLTGVRLEDTDNWTWTSDVAHVESSDDDSTWTTITGSELIGAYPYPSGAKEATWSPTGGAAGICGIKY